MNYSELLNHASRRQFLEAAGFTMSLAALSGCWRAPTVTALPFVHQPEGVVPGRMMSYASTCGGCPAGCGLLVGVRDGRPLKMEGNPEHPLSRGGLCAIGQALPLGLYDSQRLAYPLRDGQQATWDEVDGAITKQLAALGDDDAVVFVTSTVTSPTLQATIDSFLKSFPGGRHVTLDAVSSSAILDAHAETHGARLLPHYRFEQAKVIVSFGADFLGAWISPVEFMAAWRTQRTPTPDKPVMSHHVQLEGRMSLTGANADRRFRLAPSEYAAVLSHLAQDIGKRAGLELPTGQPPKSPLAQSDLRDLGERLWNARGASLVISDSQSIAVQKLVNYLNHALGNYGQTLDIEQPSRQRQASDADVAQLMADLKAGKVAALLVAGTDLTQNLPQREELAAAIKKVPLVISFAERADDFGALAHYICPDNHPLESWLDAEPVSGVVSLSQPTLQPLGQTRSILESLQRWQGRRVSAYDTLQAHWKDVIAKRAKTSSPFQVFWDQAVHNGFVEATAAAAKTTDFQFDKVSFPESQPAGEEFELALYSKLALTDSRHAHNPWLQELPDPVTKATWDNYVCLSPAAAEARGIVEGDLVKVTTASGVSLELPAMIQVGQHDRVLAVALGYGVPGTDRFAKIGPQWLEARPTVAPGELVGQNAAPCIEYRDKALQLALTNVTLEKQPGRRDIAKTQRYPSLKVPANVAPPGAEVREAVQETTLAAFAKDPHAGTPEVHDIGAGQLWPDDHPKLGHHWGMAIDLNCCTGCSACLIACQSENNVPVVGKDEVRREREMHWIRIDRYYAGDDDDLQTVHQPMMCQHCDHAPCETVCPVLATVHGAEGLNEQVYNRCVGTRYCANNCPYKVRRFNWFYYERDDDLRNLVLNPDVTVRTRGVMEKCSMCVQRIEHARIEAKRLGVPLADGAIQTACQQSCPSQAIIFGDMNDPESRVSQAKLNPRRYGVLEEFNFQPSVSYQRVVRNRDEEIGEQHSTGGDHHA
jgi:molybdopterin-containing oxidoreductase family iron-sulfur binding subunit